MHVDTLWVPEQELVPELCASGPHLSRSRLPGLDSITDFRFTESQSRSCLVRLLFPACRL